MNIKDNFQEIEHTSFVDMDFKANMDDGTFTGYASVFGVKDLGGDIVQAGAFTKSLKSRPAPKIKMLWQHKWDKVCGVWESVVEDTKGLLVKGRIIQDVEAGKEALALMREGAIDSMSIGFRTIKDQWSGSDRLLQELELHEISLVTFPMLPQAKITKVKGAFNEREVESILREAGLSKELSKNVVLFGVKKAVELSGNRREADDNDIVNILKQASNTLRR